jgi:hypothetical protein
VDDGGDLKPGRDFIIALAIAAAVDATIFSAPGVEFPVLHTILNTGIALGTVAVSLLFLDLGRRIGAPLLRQMATIFAVAGVLEIMHVLAALEPASAFGAVQRVAPAPALGRLGAARYLLPLGIGMAVFIPSTSRLSDHFFMLGTVAAAAGLFLLFQWLPRRAETGWFGILRPTPVPVPLLWIPVGVTFWRRRSINRIAHVPAWYSLGLAPHS